MNIFLFLRPACSRLGRVISLAVLILSFGLSVGLLYPRAADIGVEKWHFPTGYNVYSSPSIGPDGTIYVGSGNGKLYAINPDGTLRWSFATGDRVFSSPAIGPDGTVYFGSWDGRFYAVSCSSHGLADSPWPMFHHDLQHTGRQF